MKTLEQLSTELKELTWYNEHTQARVLIAEHFGLDKYIKIYKSIENICNVEGFTPPEISDYRDQTDYDLLRGIKYYHGEEIYNKVYNSL